MDFIDRLRELATQLPKQIPHIRTEEATKSALVMPFISALGYNVFDPTEVTPEYIADVGVKKGEKVDYVILKDGKPIIMFECKAVNADLEKITPSQLYRYFSVSPVRFGILTNGIVYKVFSDLEEPNKMDSKPFLEFNIQGIEDPVVEELKKFTKPAFNLDSILVSANEFKYTREIKRILTAQFQEPTDEFIKAVAASLYAGRLTQSLRDQFAEYIKRALNQYVNEQINSRLKFALVTDTNFAPVASAPQVAPIPSDATATSEMPAVEQKPSGRQIVTTPEEVEAYYIIKAVLHDTVEPRRVVMRDAQTYCAILLDDNNRKPICRLYFNGAQKQIAFVNEQRQEEKLPIVALDDLYKFAGKFQLVVQNYNKQPAESSVKETE